MPPPGTPLDVPPPAVGRGGSAAGAWSLGTEWPSPCRAPVGYIAAQQHSVPQCATWGSSKTPYKPRGLPCNRNNRCLHPHTKLWHTQRTLHDGVLVRGVDEAKALVRQAACHHVVRSGPPRCCSRSVLVLWGPRRWGSTQAPNYSMGRRRNYMAQGASHLLCPITVSAPHTAGRGASTRHHNHHPATTCSLKHHRNNPQPPANA